jgi:hypothetical protein
VADFLRCVWRAGNEAENESKNTRQVINGHHGPFILIAGEALGNIGATCEVQLDVAP